MPGPESDSGKERPTSLIQKLYQPHVQHMNATGETLARPHVHYGMEAIAGEQAQDKMSAEANLGKTGSATNPEKTPDPIETMRKDAAILKQSDGHTGHVRINNLVNVEGMMNWAIEAEEKLLDIPAVQELYRQGEAAAKKFQEFQKNVGDLQKKMHLPDVPNKDKKNLE